MSDSDVSYGKMILGDVVEQMKDPDDTAGKQNVVRRAILSLGYLGLIVPFVTALNEVLHSFASAVLAGVSGCLVGWAIFLQFARIGSGRSRANTSTWIVCGGASMSSNANSPIEINLAARWTVNGILDPASGDSTRLRAAPSRDAAGPEYDIVQPDRPPLTASDDRP